MQLRVHLAVKRKCSLPLIGLNWLQQPIHMSKTLLFRGPTTLISMNLLFIVTSSSFTQSANCALSRWSLLICGALIQFNLFYDFFLYYQCEAKWIEHELRCIMSRMESLNNGKMLYLMHRILLTPTHTWTRARALVRQALRNIQYAHYTYSLLLSFFIHSSIFRAPHDETRSNVCTGSETKDTIITSILSVLM